MPELPHSAAKDEIRRHFLTFRLADRRYALPAEDIAEIIRIPTVARLPQAPRALMGVANLRGSVIPVASTRSLLGQAEDSSGEGRAIVMDGSAPVALAVDSVEDLLQIPSASVETRQAELSARPEERLQGAFRPSADAEFIKILDIQSLLRGAFVARERVQTPVGRKADTQAQRSASAEPAVQTKLVTFDVNGQEYALPLECVQEIVAAPETLASVPHADAIVFGVASLRETLLPLLSLRVLLGFKAVGISGREKVVVTLVGGGLVGLVVDRMHAIFDADENRVDPVPDVLAARTGGESRIKAIYRGVGGLISILSPEQLFGDDVMRKLASSQERVHQLAESKQQGGNSLQFLVFRLGDEEFGLPIEAVEEVARVPDQIARVPKTPKFLEGVVNLRGEVLPIVDQRRRFNMPKLDDAPSRRLVVVHTAKLRAGLIVDSVSEVLRSAPDAIEPAPDLTGEASKLVQGIINLESAGRIVLVLDPSELLSRAEQVLLEAFEKGHGKPGQPAG